MVESRFIRYGQGFQTPSPHGLHGSETKVGSLSWEDPLEKEMATHSSILVWEIPWTAERGKTQAIGSQRVIDNWSNLICMHAGCSPPSSFFHGISQTRILEWVAISFSRGTSQPRDQIHVSCVSYIGRRILYHSPTWEAQRGIFNKISLLIIMQT